MYCFSARPAWKALGSWRSPLAPRSSSYTGHQTSSTGEEKKQFSIDICTIREVSCKTFQWIFFPLLDDYSLFSAPILCLPIPSHENDQAIGPGWRSTCHKCELNPSDVPGMMLMCWGLEMDAPSRDGQGVDTMGKHSL